MRYSNIDFTHCGLVASYDNIDLGQYREPAITYLQPLWTYHK